MVMLLSNLKSLTQLYTVTMDVHSRLRTESHQVCGGGGRDEGRGKGTPAGLGKAILQFVTSDVHSHLRTESGGRRAYQGVGPVGRRMCMCR